MPISYGLGEVEPSIIFVLQKGESVSGGMVLNSLTGVQYPAFPAVPTQLSRLSGGDDGTPGRYLFTDNTIRTAQGAVLQDLQKEGKPPISIGGGKTSLDVRRNPDGSPILPDSSTILAAAGIAPGVADAASKLGYDPFYYNPNGGTIQPLRRTDGLDPNIAGTSGPWIWSDGAIRTIDGVMISDADRRVNITPEDVAYVAPSVAGTRESAKGAYELIYPVNENITKVETSAPATPGGGGVADAAIAGPVKTAVAILDDQPFLERKVFGLSGAIWLLVILGVVAVKSGE